MKKRNKYFQKEKNFLKIEKALNENHKAQRQLGYIELDEPIPHGYDAFLVLRSDIANRQDAWVFEYILDLAQSKQWWRKDYTKEINRRGKDRIYIHQNTHLPYVREISENRYESLPNQVKKWFVETPTIFYHIKYYTCTVPNFYYEIKVKRHYKTHIKVLDEILLQEEAELEKEYYSSYYRNFRRIEYGAPKSYVKGFNRKYRAMAKATLRYNKNMQDMDDWKEYIVFGRHTAAWMWW